jgi:LysM domain
MNRFALSLVLLALLAGCSIGRRAPLDASVAIAPLAVPAEVAALPGLTQKERMVRAILALEQSDPATARAELKVYLAKAPKSRLGRSLLDQIERQPQTLLGPVSFPHVVEQGESWSSLAERFLDDRYRFWALARYNGEASPARLIEGSTIFIPGRLRAIQLRPRPLVSDEAEVERRLAEEDEDRREPPKEVAKEPEPPRPVIDLRRALALRKLGLERLQRGQLEPAITLLSQAIELAFGTSSMALIRKDLDRALRLKLSVDRQR